MSITVTPALSTNTIFYKYEPFSYTFTGGSNFTVGGSLVSYCTVTTSNVVFAAANGFQSTGSPLGETLVVTSSLDIVPYTFFINAGRFQISPATTSLVLYRSEPVTYTFTSSVPLTTPNGAFVTPTLPPGLTFTYQTASIWKLSGTPTLTLASSNYLFIGSNYTNGNIVSTSLPIQVLGERLVISSGPTSATSLTLGVAITPIPFTIVNYPLTASSATFKGTNLPPGLSVSTLSSNLPGASAVIVGTPTSNSTSNVTSTVTASATGLSLLTSSTTVSFNYSTVVVFTEPVITIATFYVDIPASLQVTATTLYPSNLPIASYVASVLPSGLTISASGLISGTPTTVAPSTSSTITATTLTGLFGVKTLNFTVTSNVLSATSNVPSQNFTIGLAIPSITITFAAAAGTTISTTSNVPPGITGTQLGSTVTLSGIPATLATSATMSVTATTLGALPLTVNIVYSTTEDTFTFSSVPASPFTFRQNVVITPIQFSAVASRQSAPIIYFTNTAAIPPGLYVTPAGVLQGTPTVVATNAALNGISATNGYVTIVSPSGFTYTVLADEILVTSANVSNALVLNTAINIPITLRALSGIIPSGNVSFSCYTYGITATAAAIGGTLGAGVYPDVVLPSYSVLTGTLSGLPVVFGLEATNPQTITRYTLRWNGSNVAVCKDNGSFGYSNIPLLAATTFMGHVYTDGANEHSYLQITSGAPSTPLPANTKIFGTNIAPNTTIVSGSGSTYEILPVQFAYPDSYPISYYILPGSNVPQDFQWGGDTLVIADATSNLLTSSNSTTFTLVAPSTDRTYQCSYMSNLSSWVAFGLDVDYTSNSVSVSSNADPTQGWYTPNTFTRQTPRSDGGYILRTFPTPGVSNSTRVVVGGYILSYFDRATSNLQSNGTGLAFSQYTINLTNILALSTTNKLVMGGVALPSGPSIQYSTDSNTWSNASNSFTTRTIDIVSGGSNASLGWMAIGSNGTTPGIKYSADAITWIDVGLLFTAGTAIGPLQFDGTSWCVFVGCNVYRHDAYAGNIADSNKWTVTAATFAGSSPTDVLYTFPIPRYSGTPTAVTLYIGETPNGPTFVSPSNSVYELYQYVEMTPLVFQATAAGGDIPVYFLASTPPAGMSWNSSTSTLSGRSVQLGTFSVDIYAQSLVGISKKTVTFIVSQVLISHKTPTAAAYTAYQRAKVIADAATATVNDHAVPFEVGTFLLNRPPNKVDAPEICCDPHVKSN